MRALLVVPICALVLSGCGAGDALSIDPVANAADKTAKQGSEHVRFSMQGPNFSGSGTGVFNNTATPSGQMTINVRANGQSVPMQMVMEGFVLYMKSPVFQQQGGLPAGKTWLKIDLQKAGKGMGLDLDSLTSGNPTGGLSYLRGAAGKPKKIGTETLDGVETTHYRVRCNLERAAKKGTAEQRRTIERLIRLTGVRTVPIDVWVGSDGLVRRETYVQRTRAGKPGIRVTTDFSDFGDEVDVQTPPAAEVFDVSALVGSGG